MSEPPRDIRSLLRTRASKVVSDMNLPLAEILLSEIMEAYRPELASLAEKERELAQTSPENNPKASNCLARMSHFRRKELAAEIASLRSLITKSPWTFELRRRAKLFRVAKNKQGSHIDIVMGEKMNDVAGKPEDPTGKNKEKEKEKPPEIRPQKHIEPVKEEGQNPNSLVEILVRTDPEARRLFVGKTLNVLQEENQIIRLCSCLRAASRQIRSLSLCHQRQVVVHPLFTDYLAYTQNLQQLDLSRCKLGTMDGCGILSTVARGICESLRTLNISRNKIVFSRRTVGTLVGAMGRLEELDASKNTVAADAVEALGEGVKKAPRLRRLDLTFCGVPAKCADYLAACVKARSQSAAGLVLRVIK